MSMIIGIDLGTTNSVLAYLAEDGPRIIPNALGEPLTPSVVAIDLEGKLLVGRIAREFQVLHPERCASVFKRHMGSDWTVDLAGRKYTPEELSSLVLRSLKEDAEAWLKEKIERAVITVPAYFNDHQRKSTLNAGRIAGLTVERILNEPTAAALAYGFHEGKNDRISLIFDLGGGTFDVSLVEVFDGVLEVKASAGETFLGGEDFTRTMTARVLDSIGLPFERTELVAPHLVSRLVQQCEIVKCRLSRQETGSVRIPENDGNLADNAREVQISRQDFELWTQSILNRVELPIRRVLGDAGIGWGSVDEVILVGGATRMPAVVQRVTELFGKAPQCRLNPDEVVAWGAAVQSGLIACDRSVEQMVVTDVAPFTLGISVSKVFSSERRDGYFLPIIHRNTTIPVSRVEAVGTLFPNQTDVVVQIYQGENRRVENNLLLGEFTVKGIPQGPAGQVVDIRFTYDLNGVLEIEATVVETRQKTTHVITRFARGLSARQIARAVKDMENLKKHPREDAPNRLLIRRAERMYQELPRGERDILGQFLDAFEEALASRDPEAIARNGAMLASFLDRFDSERSGDVEDREDDSDQ